MKNSLLVFGIIFMMLIFGCTQPKVENMKTVKSTDEVQVWYIGSFEDGKVFDTNIKEQSQKANLPVRSTYEPLAFRIGTGSLIKGFEDAVIGMKENETKTVRISPEDGYGKIRADLITAIPKDKLNNGQGATIGMEVQTSNGQVGKITKITNESVTIDFNHPLAGQNLVFTITLVRIVG